MSTAIVSHGTRRHQGSAAPDAAVGSLLMTLLLSFGPAMRLSLEPASGNGKRTALALLLAVLLLAGCKTAGKDGAPADKEGSAEAAPVPVEAAEVDRGTMEQVVTATATLSSDASVTLSSMASGKLLAFEVEEGGKVGKGDLIARVDAQDASLAADEAARLLAQVEREMTRLRPLVEKGFVARQVLTELEARQTSAAAARDRASLRAKDGEVRAPFDGLLLRRLVQPGALVTPGMALCDVADPTALSARFQLPERWLRSIHEGSRARLRADARPGWELETTVSRIDAAVDPSTGTIGVRLALPAAASEGLRPGMFVRAEFVVDAHEAALRIPSRAVLFRGQETSVFVLTARGKETVAERQSVKLGFEYRGRVEVLSGLKEGDRIVVVGQSGLDSGARVTARSTAETSVSGSGAPAEASGSGR